MTKLTLFQLVGNNMDDNIKSTEITENNIDDNLFIQFWRYLPRIFRKLSIPLSVIKRLSWVTPNTSKASLKTRVGPTFMWRLDGEENPTKGKNWDVTLSHHFQMRKERKGMKEKATSHFGIFDSVYPAEIHDICQMWDFLERKIDCERMMELVKKIA